MADAAADFDPVMVLVMSLLLATAMAHHGILQTHRALTNEDSCASGCPIVWPFALRLGK